MALVIVVHEKESFGVGFHVAKVEIALRKSADWAMPPLAVGLVVYTYPFPPVLLIVQHQHGTISCQNEICSSVAWEAAELALGILFEEGHILVFELHCLLGIIPRPLDHAFSNPKEVVESYHCEVSRCPLYFCRPWLLRRCDEKFGNIRLYWQLFLNGQVHLPVAI